PEIDRQSLGVGPGAPPVEQRLHVVGRGDDGAAPGGGERGVAVAGRDIEDRLAGAHVGRLGERLADDLQGDADGGVVAALPGGLLPPLDSGAIGRGPFGRGGTHVNLLRVGRRRRMRCRFHPPPRSPLTLALASCRFAGASADGAPSVRAPGPAYGTRPVTGAVRGGSDEPRPLVRRPAQRAAAGRDLLL